MERVVVSKSELDLVNAKISKFYRGLNILYQKIIVIDEEIEISNQLNQELVLSGNSPSLDEVIYYAKKIGQVQGLKEAYQLMIDIDIDIDTDTDTDIDNL